MQQPFELRMAICYRAWRRRFGYGYLLWLFPGERRQFALLGFKGQYICVDPTSKIVMVHTAIEDPVHRDEPWALWSALVDQLG